MRSVVNDPIGLALAFLIGLAIGVTMQMAGIGAGEQSRPGPSAPAPFRYGAVSDDLYGEIESSAFRLCQKVHDDQDAANLYRWAIAQIIEFRSRDELIEEHARPLIARKPVVHYMGEVIVTYKSVRFAIIATDQKPGEDVLTSTSRWAEEMESRRPH